LEGRNIVPSLQLQSVAENGPPNQIKLVMKANEGKNVFLKRKMLFSKNFFRQERWQYLTLINDKHEDE
jgi:hypothetical protein